MHVVRLVPGIVSRSLCTASTLPRKVNLAKAFEAIPEPWSPHIAGEINECQVCRQYLRYQLLTVSSFSQHITWPIIWRTSASNVSIHCSRPQVKLARMEGEFVWHHHELEDECFLVIRGDMRMKFRDGDVDCAAGELIVVPRGVEHCPVALSETCDVLLVERSETINTGSAAETIGDSVHEHGVSPLTKTELKRI